ncbi:hypothetical protein D3C71_957310 [compost metagenome]
MLLSQHDWLKIGFKKIDGSGSGSDGYLDPDAPPTFFTELVNSFDTDKSGELSSEEIQAALQNSSNAEQLHKLIVKHPSEWYEKSSTSTYLWLDKLMAKIGLPDFDKLVDHEKQRIDKLEWMQSAAKLKLDKEVWHVSPMKMIVNVEGAGLLINVDAFVLKYKEMHRGFAVGTPVLSSQSEKNLQKLIENINKFYANNDSYAANIYQLAYMLATARHETYHFPSGEYFSEKPEVGPISYFDKYDPILADTPARRERARLNGNTVEGDGYKYRGRGCVHLTWKKNYQRAKDNIGIDFVSFPERAADFDYAVSIMIWGMRDGVFTGASLNDHINKSSVNYVSARKIINGSDAAALIASYAEKFQSILEVTSIVSKEF